MGYAKAHNVFARTTDAHRIDILDEELDAWHRGWELALKLKVLSLNDKASFDKTRIRYVKTYVKWAARATGFESYCQTR